MKIILDLLDELWATLTTDNCDPSRTAFEAIALEQYRERKLSTAQVGKPLGFESRHDLDGFLKRHEVWLEYTSEDLDRDRETHRRLGL